MTRMTSLYGRAGATAIAAALALTSTPLLAQEADPLVPDPVVEPVPEPVSDPVDTSASDPLAPEAETTVKTAAVPPAKAVPERKPVKTASARPAENRVPARTATPPAEAAAPAVGSEAATELPYAPQPVSVEPVSEVAAAEPKQDVAIDEDAAIAGGAVLGLLALGGAAVAMRRRRREDEDYGFEEPRFEPHHAARVSEPIADPTPVFEDRPVPPRPVSERPQIGPASAAIGTAPFMLRPAQPAEVARPSESWTERAMRGPTPENPSLSLKKRLKRAAFFDGRARDAAAGTAPAVDATAGLPERAVREFEPA